MTRKNLTLLLGSLNERMLRVWSAMTDQTRPEALDSALRCGLADAARARGRDFERAFRAACGVADVDLPGCDGVEIGCEPHLNSPDGEPVRCGFVMPAGTVKALHAYATLAGCTISDAANKALRARLLRLATLRGERFREAFLQASSHALEAL